MHLSFSSPLAWTSIWVWIVLSRTASFAIAPELEFEPNINNDLDTFPSNHYVRAQIGPRTPTPKLQLPPRPSSPIRRIKSAPALGRQDNSRQSSRPKQEGPGRGGRNGGSIGEAIRTYGGTGLSPQLCKAILHGVGEVRLKEYSFFQNQKTHHDDQYQHFLSSVREACIMLFEEEENSGYVFKQLSRLEKDSRQLSLAFQRRFRAGQKAEVAKNELDRTRKVMDQLGHGDSGKNGLQKSPTASRSSSSSSIRALTPDPKAIR